MEINKFDNVIGVIPVADIVEGRLIVTTSHTHDYDYGSKADLPGAKVPATAEEAKMARFIITWAVTQAKPPFYSPMPYYSWSLRSGGMDKTANLPMENVDVYLTYPGHVNGATIPSGIGSLAFGTGTYTVPSGCYINNASISTPGALLQVANTAEDTTDAGKLKYLSAFGDRCVGVVEHYDSSTGDLRFRLRSD